MSNFIRDQQQNQKPDIQFQQHTQRRLPISIKMQTPGKATRRRSPRCTVNPLRNVLLPLRAPGTAPAPLRPRQHSPAALGAAQRALGTAAGLVAAGAERRRGPGAALGSTELPTEPPVCVARTGRGARLCPPCFLLDLTREWGVSAAINPRGNSSPLAIEREKSNKIRPRFMDINYLCCLAGRCPQEVRGASHPPAQHCGDLSFPTQGDPGAPPSAAPTAALTLCPHCTAAITHSMLSALPCSRWHRTEAGGLQGPGGTGMRGRSGNAASRDVPLSHYSAAQQRAPPTHPWVSRSPSHHGTPPRAQVGASPRPAGCPWAIKAECWQCWGNVCASCAALPRSSPRCAWGRTRGNGLKLRGEV